VLNIEVSYNEDPRKVKEVLLDIASKTPNLIQSPEPSAVFTGFNASSLAFALRVFCRTDKQLSVGDHIRTEVLLRFREENIEIPYQKIDIQIKEVIQTKSSS
jgi:small-conductance mechanosensitive channel